MDITKLKRIHFTGIKGVGMTALALCIKDLKVEVTGSDIDELFVTDEVLKRNEIKWSVGFGEKNLTTLPDLLVTTAAHGGLLNLEVQKAKTLGVQIKTYAEAMSEIANMKKVIGVCGVGGKTTVSSMVATLLDKGRLHPSFVIGVGNIFPLGTSGRYDKKGKYFVCEADDYVVSPGVNDTPKFFLLKPSVLVVTNIEYDHPDIYKSFDQTKKTFRKLFEKIPKGGLLVACCDNENVSEVIKGLKVDVTTYGFNKSADWVIENYSFEEGKTLFTLYSKKDKKRYENLELKVPGEFNIQNAVGAFVVGHFLGLSESELREGISSYLGCRRRFENMGKINEALFIDDYAHHPREIEATLKAAREWFPKKRIVAIFQPHTYSRTKALFKEFALSFKNADLVGFMDIYCSSREKSDPTVNSKSLTLATKKYKNNSYYLGDHEETLKWIKNNIEKEDVVLTMGAGDIFYLYKHFN